MTSITLSVIELLALFPKKKVDSPISSRKADRPKQVTITLDIVLFSTLILLNLRNASAKKQAPIKTEMNTENETHLNHV